MEQLLTTLLLGNPPSCLTAFPFDFALLFLAPEGQNEKLPYAGVLL